MADEIAAPAADAPVAAEGADAEAIAAAAAAEPAAPAAEPDPFEDEKVETFDRKYVERLRKEAADARVKAKEAKAPFEAWNDDAIATWQAVIQTAATDPKTGAASLREIADFLDKGDVEGAANAAAGASDAAAAVLTPEDVDKKVQEALAARDKDGAIQAKANEIVKFATDHGYEAKDDNPDYFALLHVAQHQTGGDLEKAHEVMEARKQAVIDSYLENIRNRAANEPTNVKTANAPVVDPTAPIKTMEDASNRLRALLGARK